MKFEYIYTILLLGLFSCNSQNSDKVQDSTSNKRNAEIIILGILQDGGSPHIGCTKECCTDLFNNPNPNRKVVALGLIDHDYKSTFLFEATPDISAQMKLLKKHSQFPTTELPNGIFLTHAHIGHYSGLMYLGKEAKGAKEVPVFCMPKMNRFLRENGPWSQLVSQKNIVIKTLQADSSIKLTSSIKITPFLVPHRDEYSETVGYKIQGPHKTALFIPDINKWNLWERSIIDEIKKVDYAFIDATFFDSLEINSRPMSEIPHPFVLESMDLFKNLPAKEKNKIYFIHLNHTNPLLNPKSKASQLVENSGFHIAQFRDSFTL